MEEKASFKKPEGKIGEEILDRMDEDHTPIALWSLTNLDVNEDDVTLDIGCGSGLNVRRLFEKSPKAKSYGVDFSKTSVKKSTLMNKKNIDDGNIEIFEANVLDMPFGDETIDVATAFSTVFFWPNIISAFQEVRRVLKPNGKFFIVQGINGTENYQPPEMEEDDEGAIFYNDLEFKDMLFEAGFSSITCVIRKIEDKKIIKKAYDFDGYNEEILDDTFVYEDKNENSHGPEWLCVLAIK